MLQIEIDGKELSVEQGKTIIEAAHQAGTYIPHFCYHKKLSIAANCRMCLVEVEKAPKPLPACATPVTDGMKVKTDSVLAKQAQQGVMEFLLINHPLDCPICDQGGECQLQDLAVGYGKSGSRYREAKRAVIGKEMGPLVSAAEMSRCIHCTRCVRFTEEIAGLQEIGMVFRGEFSEIMPFVGEVVHTELSGNVIDLCPVGALTSKPFRYEARAWELSRRKSISAHDSLGSNLIVQTKDHLVKRVLPLENEAINECWLSDRDRFAYEGLNHIDRLARPRIKQNNEWHEVEWPVALDYVAQGLKGVSAQFGGQGVGFWVNAANTLEEMYLARQLAQTIGTDAIDADFLPDSRVKKSFQGASWLGQSIEALSASEVILVIGANLRTEQPLLTARLRQAAKKGARIHIINSAPEELLMPAVQKSLHPGAWLAELQNGLSDQAGHFGADLKKAEKSSIVLGSEAQQLPFYAEIYSAAQKLGEETNSVLGVLPQAANSVGAALLGLGKGTDYGAMLREPKKAVVLMNIDPGADVPDAQAAQKALKQADTVIAMTPYVSAALLECADVLLPIAPFTETSGSFINMEGRLQSFYGVVQPFVQTRPLWKVLRVLGNLMEAPDFDYTSSEEILAKTGFTGNLADKLDNHLSGQFDSDAASAREAVWRVGGTSMYQTDAIVRRSAPLQATDWSRAPVARMHPQTMFRLGAVSGEEIDLLQNDYPGVKIVCQSDGTVPENIVVLPKHAANAGLGALMTPIGVAVAKH